MSVTEDIKRRLRRIKDAMDADVPNHGYDSGFALAARAGGIEDAIAIVEEVERDPKVRRIKLDPSPNVRLRKSNKRGVRGSDRQGSSEPDET